MENVDKSVALVAVLHLKEAAALLANAENGISMTLVDLAQCILDLVGIQKSAVDDAQQTIAQISKKDEQ